MRAAAGFISAFLGLGFGIPCAFGIAHFAKTGEVWTFMGFPTYGGGPFERIGLETSVPLLVGFLVVCMAECILAALLWSGSPAGPVMAYMLLPFELVFWIGFALPLGPPLGIASGLLVFLSTR